MTIKEAAQIIGILQFNYPDTMRDLTGEAYKIYVRQWHSFFADDDYKIVEAAVRAHIATSTDHFMPNVGQIKEEIRKLTAPDELSEAEAWAKVSKALSNGLYGYKEEYAKLPPAVQRAVGTPQTLREWAMLDTETVQSVIASNFQRSYRAAAKQEAELAKLPPGFRDDMRKIAGAMFKPLELEEGERK